MFHIAKIISPLNEYVNTFFNSFKTELINLSKIQWKDEDLKGTSNVQWKIQQYYNLMYLLIIVSTDYERTKLEWSYYVEKYNLVKFKKCVGCEGINFNLALEAFNLPVIIEGGLELMNLEDDFEVNTEGYTLNNIMIKDLLTTGNTCTNYIN